jgi:hypothetical protein
MAQLLQALTDASVYPEATTCRVVPAPPYDPGMAYDEALAERIRPGYARRPR